MRNSRWRDPFGKAAYLRDPGYWIGLVVLGCLGVVGVSIKTWRDLVFENQERERLLQDTSVDRPPSVSAIVLDPELTLQQLQAKGIARPIHRVRVYVMPAGYGVSVDTQSLARRQR